jgi:hypothetical protein
MKIRWPGGKQFAFTFCDDTDFATLENTRPVYDFLNELGLRTTKLVWLFDGHASGGDIGTSCTDAAYLDWVHTLQRQGHEVGLHNVAPDSSPRLHTEKGLAQFAALFGGPPRVHCNHGICRDNLYWGAHRLSGWRRVLYNTYSRNVRQDISEGHLPESEFFWGDLALEQIHYVRNFTFDQLNTLACCPQMPYHDPTKPYVNFWFAGSNAASAKHFRQNFSRATVDQLIAEGGLCLAYTHFGAQYYQDGQLDAHFRKMMRYIASQPGWFAPVSEILDFLRQDAAPTARQLTARERGQLEWRWLWNKRGKKMGI